VERKTSRRRVLPIDVDWDSTTHQVQLTNHSDSNRQSPIKIRRNPNALNKNSISNRPKMGVFRPPVTNNLNPQPTFLIATAKN